MSQDIDVLKNEIKAIDQINKFANGNERYQSIARCIPTILALGMHRSIQKEVLGSNGRASIDSEFGSYYQDNNSKMPIPAITPLIPSITTSTHHAYYIMPRYGKSLQYILNNGHHLLSKVDIFSIANKLVSILELIHDSGLVYNDIKPDNILLGDHLTSLSRQSSNSD